MQNCLQSICHPYNRAFTTGTPPAPRYHHSAVVYGSSMFVFGTKENMFIIVFMNDFCSCIVFVSHVCNIFQVATLVTSIQIPT